MSARRLTLWIAGFVLAVVAAEFVAGAVMETSEPSIRWYDAATEIKVNALDAGDEVDVLFAGTSSAWQGFVPSVWQAEGGGTAYNVGLAGGTPEVMQRWLPEEAEPRARPATVLWGLSSFDVAPEYGQVQQEAYDDAPETREGWLADVERAAASVSTLVRERTVLRSPDQLWGDGYDERVEDRAEAETITADDGERRDFTEDTYARRAAIVRARLRDIRPDPDDLDRIADTVQRLGDRGVEVVLVQLPMPDRFVALHPDGAADYAQVAPALAGLADELGVRFLDLTDGFTDDDFVDFTHLDEDGAARLTRQAIEAYGSGRNDA